jgi:hypothetical protein
MPTLPKPSQPWPEQRRTQSASGPPFRGPIRGRTERVGTPRRWMFMQAGPVWLLGRPARAAESDHRTELPASCTCALR